MDDNAQTLHSTATIVDCLQISNWSPVVFENMRRGGLTAVNCTCSILENFRDTIRNIVWWQHAFERHADLIVPVRRVGDIAAAKNSARTGIILGFQNTSAIEDDLDLLGVFHGLGVRVMQLTYMEANLVGQGCLERIDAGLTGFGREVVAEMNRLGILIDLSHVGHRTTMEAIEASAQPVAFTHANPARLCDHPRNQPDDALKAVAATGGVVGATVFPPFLPEGNDATLDDFARVVDYLVELIGIDHVAVGTDFTEGQPREWFDWILTGKSKRGPQLALDHPLRNPEGIRSASDFGNLTAALLRHGYRPQDVRKIMGENMVRLLARVWQVSEPADDERTAFHDIKERLELTAEHRLMLESVPMVLLPRWFFAAIMQRIAQLSDAATARQVLYEAGWEGAAKWVTEQMARHGLSGRAVMEQYMASAGQRGWGDLRVTAYDEAAGRVTVTLTHSSVAEEIGTAGRAVCDHLPGSIAGAMETIVATTGRRMKLAGRETKCIAKGDAHCEFEVAPAE